MWKLIPDEYHYHKGGGNAAMIYMMMEMQKQAEQAKQAEAERNARAEQQALEREERLKREAAVEKTQKIEKTGQKVSDAYNVALSDGKRRLQAKGIDADTDPYGIMGLYTSSLDKARTGLPEIVEDTSNLFSPSLLEDAISNVRTTQRNKVGADVKNTFADDYGLQAFGDTADDHILQSILDSQKSEAVTALDRALARGRMNEAGRSIADKELENMAKMGLAKANSLGGTVLSGYRQQLDDAVGKVRSKANEWDFNSGFDLNKERSTVDNLKGSLSSRLEGDILNALSGQSFFDTDILLGKGGTASGINNGMPAAGGAASNNGLIGPSTGVTDRTKSNTSSSTRKLTPLDEVF